MKKKFFTALIAVVMVFSLTACQGLSSDKGTTYKTDDGSDSLTMPPKTLGSEGDSPVTTPAGELDEETEHKLYNLYVNINNAMLGRINDSLNRYFNYVNTESEEFQLWEEGGDYYDCYSISSTIVSDVEDAYEILSGKAEKDALDQAFLNMYPSITSLMQTLNEISDYTTPKTYLEDDFAKSQEHHTALLSVLEEYFTTGNIFLDELTVVAYQRQMEDLEQMKAEGYEVTYSLNMVMLLAQQIEDELYVQDVWDDNILDMDLTTIQPLYDAFSTYVDAVLVYSEDNDALRAEGFSNSGNLSLFVMYMKSTRESLSKVLAKVEKGEPLSQGDMMITSIAGQCNLSSFAEGISDMIESYNRLISY